MSLKNQPIRIFSLKIGKKVMIAINIARKLEEAYPGILP